MVAKSNKNLLIKKHREFMKYYARDFYSRLKSSKKNMETYSMDSDDNNNNSKKKKIHPAKRKVYNKN